MRYSSEALEEHIKQLNIICFAVVSGMLIFAGLVWYLVAGGGFTPPEGLPSYLAMVLNLTGLVFLVKAHFLPRISPGPSQGAPEEARIAWHKRNTILGFALREGGAFVALVGVLLTGQMAGGFAVAGLAILAMVFAWPRAEQVTGGH